MPDALELALQNAAYNAPKDSPVHLENLESIADPTRDEPAPNTLSAFREMEINHAKTTEFQEAYRLRMQDAYKNAASVTLQYSPKEGFDQNTAFLPHVRTILSEMTLISMKIDSLAETVNNIALVIQNASVQSMSQAHFDSAQQAPDLRHRSLDQWNDSQLINELVERENDLMPFYFELLKRIGSPELHNLVMSSMQGKNASMMTLAQLCSVMGASVQGTPPQAPVQYPSGQSQISQQQLERLQSMSQVERNDFVQRINSVVPQAIPNWENSFPQH